MLRGSLNDHWPACEPQERPAQYAGGKVGEFHGIRNEDYNSSSVVFFGARCRVLSSSTSCVDEGL